MDRDQALQICIQKARVCTLTTGWAKSRGNLDRWAYNRRGNANTHTHTVVPAWAPLDWQIKPTSANSRRALRERDGWGRVEMERDSLRSLETFLH